MAKASVKNSVNTRWFKQQLAKRDLSQREAARRLAINQASISHMFKGTRKMPLEEAQKWAELFQVPLEEVLSNVSLNSTSAHISSNSVEVLGSVDGDLNVQWGVKTGPKRVPNPLSSSDVGVVHCRIAAGQFEGLDGAFLYYGISDKFDTESIGRISLVKFQGKSAIRIVKRGYESGRHNLFLINGLPKEEGVLLDSATPIMWMKL